MTAYFVAYAFLFFSIGIGLLTRRLRTAVVAGFLPLIFLVAARGLVGTDTAQYISIIRRLWVQGLFAVELEPVFGIITSLLMRWLHDPFTVLVVISVGVGVLMLFAGLRLEKVPIIFSALVLPYFMLDMTMNGVRYGLAFALVTLATVFLLRGKRLLFVLIGAIAALTQISALILVAGIWTLLEARLRTFAAVVIMLVAFAFFFGGYLDDKASAYAEVQILSALSGTVPLVLGILMIAALATIREIRETSIPQLAVLLAAVFGAFIMTRFSSGGLRVQAIILFLIYLYGAARIYRLSINVWRQQLFIVAMIVVAIAGGAFRYKNLNDDKNFGPTPFNPYYFIWNHYGFD